MTSRLLLALCVPALSAGCVVDDGGTDGGPDDGCALGRFAATSTAFEESGCLETVTRDGGTLAATAAGFSWQVESFGDLTAGVVLDISNSSARASYVREGLEWVVATGFDGGQDLGESTLTVDTVTDTTWQGDIDGVAIPGAGNDSFESVFVTVTVPDA